MISSAGLSEGELSCVAGPALAAFEPVPAALALPVGAESAEDAARVAMSHWIEACDPEDDDPDIPEEGDVH
jgi:hypothetical protein